jgi:hypothetical protein
MAWMPKHFLTLLIASTAYWLERQSALQIEYLKAEKRALRNRTGSTRCRPGVPVGVHRLRAADGQVQMTALIGFHPLCIR